jgi:hypothetical protein
MRRDDSALARLPIEPMVFAWHIRVIRCEQIDALASLIRRYPGTMPIVLHADGMMCRIACGIASSLAVREELIALVGFGNIREEREPWAVRIL